MGGFKMNRKILAILTILVVALSITAVSASGLFDFAGDSQKAEAQNVTIDGIDFVIPAGYTEDESLAVDGVKNDTEGVKYTTWGKTYENDAHDVISIGVATYDGVEVDESMPAYIGGAEKTINGVNGYEYKVGSFDGFTYAKNGKLVIISLTDAKALDELIVK